MDYLKYFFTLFDVEENQCLNKYNYKYEKKSITFPSYIFFVQYLHLLINDQRFPLIPNYFFMEYVNQKVTLVKSLIILHTIGDAQSTKLRLWVVADKGFFAYKGKVKNAASDENATPDENAALQGNVSCRINASRKLD